jgi:transposase-like protein
VRLNSSEETSFSAVGRKYGVSDNAIRKWIKNYQKNGND